MGGASSKAARSLPKSSVTSQIPKGAGSSAGGAVGTTSSNVPSSSRPAGSSSLGNDSAAGGRTSEQDAMNVAERIGGAGRKASPLNTDPRGDAVGPVVERSQGASESKDETIRKDAFDPDFVTQLNRLGPVNVPPAPWQGPHASGSKHHMSPLQPMTASQSIRSGQSQMDRILQARKERDSQNEAFAEQQAASGKRSEAAQQDQQRHMDTSTIVAMLDEAKGVESQADLKRLATQYDFDPTLLRSLMGRYNAPSIGGRIDPEDAKWNEQRDADKPPRVYALWTDPKWKAGERSV